MKQMENPDSKHPSQAQVLFGTDFLPLKELNERAATLQLLIQDYDIRTMPQWVGFTTTNVCNLKCPHCQTHGTEETRNIYNHQTWSGKTLTRLAKESLPYAYEFSLTLNGEPLCTPKIKEKLDELAKYGAKLHLTTNGTNFSKEILVAVLPLARSISISIDGATELACEAIRLGANLKKLSNNIRLLTRACELLPEINPDIRLAFTVMASNIRDMPELVRLAHVLEVPAIDFYSLIVLFPHVRDEDIKLHKPLYNYYAVKTQKEAKCLSITVNMPDIFPGINASSDDSTMGTDMIVQQLPNNYYATRPSPESFLNHHDIEVKTAEIAAAIKKRALNINASMEITNNVENDFHLKLDLYNTLLDKHKGKIEDFSAIPEINYCESLFRRMFISHSGDASPCCYPNRPVLGNINKYTIEEIWNGTIYNNFRQEFYSSNLPDCCKDCPSLTKMPRQKFLISFPK